MPEGTQLAAKVRSLAKPVPVVIEGAMGSGAPCAIRFLQPEFGVAPGQAAVIYDRAKLRQGDVIPGPAIVIEMDSTTLIETGCVAVVDRVGNILINLA
jgi:N-methylhydantoinase A